MSACGEQTSSLIVCHFLELEPCLSPEGWPFTEWPARMTVVPWFEPNGVNLQQICDTAKEAAQHIGPTNFTITDQVLSGATEVFSVVRVEDPNGSLHALHDQIAVSLGMLGCNFTRKILEDYSPHITRSNHGQNGLGIGSKRQLCSLAIVGCRSNGPLKKVLRIINLSTS